MTRVKICGCMSVDDVEASKEAGADFVGIMFAPNSRRRVSVEDALSLVQAAGAPLRELGQDEPPPLHRARAVEPGDWFAEGAKALDRLLLQKRPLTVGIFEDQPLKDVNQIADDVNLDLIQLSGVESWSDCLLANRQTIKTIETPPSLDRDGIAASLIAGGAIACLFDPSRGQGVPADLRTAAAIAEVVPLWLAGGLSPENVGQAIRRVRPWAVDVSSGVESGGRKDPVKIRAFVEAARMAIAPERNR